MPAPSIDDIEIIVATAEDWQAVREIRLEALLRDPQAFGSTYAATVGRTEQDWRARTQPSGSTKLLERTAARPVGIVGGLRGDDAGDASVGVIVSMYVSASHRRRGVGRRLLQAQLHDFASDPDIRTARLFVHTGQFAAVRLYAALGFQPVGEQEGEIIMERPLRP
ncbi:MAG: GNAT family N-acetyltransferase [Thermomicrobiales bacterium]|nr:GNAT family N-acetyltransferase [Thermomicrobiales bacterium]